MNDSLRIEKLVEVLKEALYEDVGRIDLTTSYIVSKSLNVEADIIVKQDGIVAGLPIIELLYSILDKKIAFKPVVKDSDKVYTGKTIAYLSGPAQPILTGERVALNFLSHLSGIATLTRKYADKVKDFDVKIRDTRKTTPALRYVEKYAVRAGGGYNHRMGLYDGVLIKDNHLRCEKIAMMHDKVKDRSEIYMAVQKAKRDMQENTQIELEVENILQLKEALKLEIDMILLDNMTVQDVKEAVKLRNEAALACAFKKKILFEVSGGITLENVSEYAACGVEMISIGSLTHSAPALDISLEIMK